MVERTRTVAEVSLTSGVVTYRPQCATCTGSQIVIVTLR